MGRIILLFAAAVMCFILAAAALTALIMFIVDCIKHKKDDDTVGGCVGSSICFIACLCLGLFAIYGANKCKAEYHASYHTLVCEIKTLDRGTNTEGHFTLGCGTINSYPAYYYYQEVKPNVYQIQSISTKEHKIYIVETADYSPSIYKVKDAEVDANNYYYNIYVPFNTVISQYSI